MRQRQATGVIWSCAKDYSIQLESSQRKPRLIGRCPSCDRHGFTWFCNEHYPSIEDEYSLEAFLMIASECKNKTTDNRFLKAVINSFDCAASTWDRLTDETKQVVIDLYNDPGFHCIGCPQDGSCDIAMRYLFFVRPETEEPPAVNEISSH
jgi:hypothetical protein